METCCFANVNLLFFAIFVAITVIVAKAPYCCDLEILLPW